MATTALTVHRPPRPRGYDEATAHPSVAPATATSARLNQRNHTTAPLSGPVTIRNVSPKKEVCRAPSASCAIAFR